MNIGDAAILQRLGREGRDRNGNVLDIFRPPLRRDGDFLQHAGYRTLICRSLGVNIGRSEERDYCSESNGSRRGSACAPVDHLRNLHGFPLNTKRSIALSFCRRGNRPANLWRLGNGNFQRAAHSARGSTGSAESMAKNCAPSPGTGERCQLWNTGATRCCAADISSRPATVTRTTPLHHFVANDVCEPEAR